MQIRTEVMCNNQGGLWHNWSLVHQFKSAYTLLLTEAENLITVLTKGTLLCTRYTNSNTLAEKTHKNHPCDDKTCQLSIKLVVIPCNRRATGF